MVNEYNDKIYVALKAAYPENFDLSEDEFNQELSSDSNFASKIHGALKAAYPENFDLSENDFYDKVGLKKKEEISGEPSADISNQHDFTQTGGILSQLPENQQKPLSPLPLKAGTNGQPINDQNEYKELLLKPNKTPEESKAIDDYLQNQAKTELKDRKVTTEQQKLAIDLQPKTAKDFFDKWKSSPEEAKATIENPDEVLSPERQLDYLKNIETHRQVPINDIAQQYKNFEEFHPVLNAAINAHNAIQKYTGAGAIEQGVGRGLSENIVKPLAGTAKILEDAFVVDERGDNVFKSTAKYLNDYSDYLQAHAENVPTVDGVTSDILSGGGNLVTFVASMAMSPEAKIKAIQTLTKGLVNGIPKIAVNMATTSGLNKYNESDDKSVLDKYSESTGAGLKGLAIGYALDGMGYIAGGTGKFIKGVTGSNVAGHIATAASNTILFPAFTATENAIEGKGTTDRELISSGALGFGMSASPMLREIQSDKELAKQIQKQQDLAWNNFATTDIKDIQVANTIKTPISDLRVQQIDIENQIEAENKKPDKDVEKLKSLGLASNTLSRIIDLKAVTNQVLENPGAIVNAIEADPSLTPEAKQFHIDKLNQIVKENDPRYKASQPMVDEMNSIYKEQEYNTKSLDPIIAEQKNSILNDRLKELSGKIDAELRKPLSDYDFKKGPGLTQQGQNTEVKNEPNVNEKNAQNGQEKTDEKGSLEEKPGDEIPGSIPDEMKNQQIYDDLLSAHGEADNILKSNYMLLDSRLINKNKLTHEESAQKIGVTKGDVLKSGVIRIADGGQGFEFSKKPTDSQSNRLGQHLIESPNEVNFDTHKDGIDHTFKFDRVEGETPEQKAERAKLFLKNIGDYYDGQWEPTLRQYDSEFEGRIKTGEYDSALLPEVEQEINQENDTRGTNETFQPNAEGEATGSNSEGFNQQANAGENEPTTEPDYSEFGKVTGVSNKVLAEIAKQLGIEAPEPGVGTTKEKAIALGNKLLDAGADIDKIKSDFDNSNKDGKGLISEGNSAVVAAYHDRLIKDVYAKEKQFGKDSKEYKDALDKAAKFEKNLVQPIKTAWSNIGKTFQGARDVDTGDFISMEIGHKARTGKDFTPNEAKEAKRQADEYNKIVEEQKKKDAEITELRKQLDAEKAKRSSEKKADEIRRKNISKERRSQLDQSISDRLLRLSGAKLAEGDIGTDQLKDIAGLVKDVAERWALDIADAIKKIVKENPHLSHLFEGKDEEIKKGISDLREEEETTKAEQDRIKAEEKEKSDLEGLQSQLDELEKTGIIPKKPKSKPKDISEAKQVLKDKIQDVKDKIRSEQKKYEKLDNLKKQLKYLQETNEIPEKPKRPKIEVDDDVKVLKDKIKAEQDRIKENNDNKRITQRFRGKTDAKFTPDEQSDIWDYAQKYYIGKEGYNYIDMVNGLANDLGLDGYQVRKALSLNKSINKASDEAYYLSYKRRRAKEVSIKWLANLDKSWAQKAVEFVPKFFFGLKTALHGTVGMQTHSGMQIFEVTKWDKYWKNAGRQFKFAFGGLTERGKAKYEQAMTDLMNDPNYVKAKRAGLAVDPDVIYDDYTGIDKSISDFVNTHEKGLGKLGTTVGNKIGGFIRESGEMGTRGFNALKTYRMDMFNYYYDKLPKSVRDLEHSPDIDDRKEYDNHLKMISDIANLSSGSSRGKFQEWTNIAFFAPKLESSRWQKMIKEPFKMFTNFTHLSHQSLAERYRAKIVARKMGETVAVYLGGMAANQGFLSAIGSKHKVNAPLMNYLGGQNDPSKSDWLKFKTGNFTTDLSGGIVSTVDFTGKMVNAFITGSYKKHGKMITEEDIYLKEGAKYARGKLSPFASHAIDVLMKRTYFGDVVPWSSDDPGKYNEQLGWGKYLANQESPIFIAEGLKDMAQSMKDQGISEAQAREWFESSLIAVITGGTGVKVGRMRDDSDY